MAICCHRTSISLLLTATSFTFAVTVGGFLTMLSPCVATAATSELRMGVAAVKITPPLGTPMAGYYGERKSQGVLDDLYAKAVVIDDGKTKAAMVVCDVIGLSQTVVVEARQMIQEKTGIPADNVMISATHTHTGPVILRDSKLDDLVAAGNKLSQDYLQQLPKWIDQVVEEANGRVAVVRVSYGRQDEPSLSFIRRFWMKDGSVGWNPGKLNPNIVRPIGVVDPQVNVVYAETVGTKLDAVSDKMAADGSHHAAASDRKPMLTYINYANHLDTTGGNLISADYPATLARRLADYKGAEMLTIFANGTCGNINHLDVGSATAQTSPTEAKRIGTVLAGAVLKSYLYLTAVGDTTLRVRREVVSLPLPSFTDDELREARDIVAKNGDHKPFLQQVKAYRIVDVAARGGKPFEVDVQVFTLGSQIAWVALPGEVFVELGLSIKAASPFRQTNVIELANGFTSYVPNRSAFAEGQYEVVTSRYAEGAGEKLVTTAIKLLGELHQDAVRGAAESQTGVK